MYTPVPRGDYLNVPTGGGLELETHAKFPSSKPLSYLESCVPLASIGVLGSANETAWETALETLTIPVPHRSKMVKAAIATALEGYTNILAARYALLQGPDG